MLKTAQETIMQAHVRSTRTLMLLMARNIRLKDKSKILPKNNRSDIFLKGLRTTAKIPKSHLETELPTRPLNSGYSGHVMRR